MIVFFESTAIMHLSGILVFMNRLRHWAARYSIVAVRSKRLALIQCTANALAETGN